MTIRLLVTGASGFIGGRLAQALADDAAFALTLASRQLRPVPARAKSVAIDWQDPASIAAACAGQDVIIHLAAMAEAACNRDPEAALTVNGLYSLRLVEAAKAAGVGRVIHLSTSKVFGQNPCGVITEDSKPVPTSHYAITHRLAEDYVLAQGGVVVRLSNSLGAPAGETAGDAWSVIANDFCRQAVSTGVISLKSSGMQWRNFVAMAEVVAALRHLALLPKDKLGDGLFHLGGPHPLRIRDLAALVADQAEPLLGQRPRLDIPEPQPGEDFPQLDWRRDKLLATGLTLDVPLKAEIAATLTLCLKGA